MRCDVGMSDSGKSCFSDCHDFSSFHTCFHFEVSASQIDIL